MEAQAQGEDPGEVMARPLWKRVRDYTLGTAILFLFIVTLMTSIAQQEVVTRLKDAKLNVSYSAGWKLAREAEDGKAQIKDLEEDERRHSIENQQKQSAARVSDRAVEAAWLSFIPIAARLNRPGVCQLTPPSDNSAAVRMATLSDVEACINDVPETQPASRILEAAHKEVIKVRKALDVQSDAVSDLTRHTEYLESIRERIKSTINLTEEQKVSQAAFSDTGVFTENWLLLRGALIKVPPPMLQVLLTLFSGWFGALLLTLILVVYPSNVLHGDAKTQAFTRTLLGGPIAVCVYIVILGSSAVLGSSSGLAAAGTNYMALCAVGILAGMFSDRVANWLSEKADAFFKRSASTRDKQAGTKSDGKKG